jgi:hypothetical protein
VCIGSIFGGSIGSFLFFPGLLAIGPIYVVGIVGLLSSLALGRETSLTPDAW